MQWFIFCIFLIAIVCLVMGLRKSTIALPTGPKQYCTACGWTQEMVQPCQFERHHLNVVAPLCFDCCIKRDAVPIKTHPVNVGLTM